MGKTFGFYEVICQRGAVLPNFKTVNKGVHKFTLLLRKYLISCHQFIERAEMGSGGQQIAVENLKDNPR